MHNPGFVEFLCNYFLQQVFKNSIDFINCFSATSGMRFIIKFDK